MSIRSFNLEFNRDYGIDRRTGWTVVIDGIVHVQFARGPLRAIALGLFRHWRMLRDMRVEGRRA
jgi:hypothetical protein